MGDLAYWLFSSMRRINGDPSRHSTIRGYQWLKRCKSLAVYAIILWVIATVTELVAGPSLAVRLVGLMIGMAAGYCTWLYWDVRTYAMAVIRRGESRD